MGCIVQSMSKLVWQNPSRAQESQKRWYDQNACIQEFHPGVRVLVLLPTSTNKLLARWQGPYQVLQQVVKVNYLVDCMIKGKEREYSMSTCYGSSTFLRCLMLVTGQKRYPVRIQMGTFQCGMNLPKTSQQWVKNWIQLSLNNCETCSRRLKMCWVLAQEEWRESSIERDWSSQPSALASLQTPTCISWDSEKEAEGNVSRGDR